jgi:hypothetical protein
MEEADRVKRERPLREIEAKNRELALQVAAIEKENVASGIDSSAHISPKLADALERECLAAAFLGTRGLRSGRFFAGTFMTVTFFAGCLVAAFLAAAFCLVHLLRCASAILFRSAADIVRLFAVVAGAADAPLGRPLRFGADKPWKCKAP